METTSFRTSSTSILRDVFHGKISDASAAHGVGQRVGRDDENDDANVTLGLRTKTYESQTRKRGLPEKTKTRSCKKTGKYRTVKNSAVSSKHTVYVRIDCDPSTTERLLFLHKITLSIFIAFGSRSM